jgi:hypothetical protein
MLECEIESAKECLHCMRFINTRELVLKNEEDVDRLRRILIMSRYITQQLNPHNRDFFQKLRVRQLEFITIKIYRTHSESNVAVQTRELTKRISEWRCNAV